MKTVNSELVLSHDHLVEAVRQYLDNNQVFWPFPDNAEIVDIDFGLTLDEDGERYSLDITLEIDELE